MINNHIGEVIEKIAEITHIELGINLSITQNNLCFLLSFVQFIKWKLHVDNLEEEQRIEEDQEGIDFDVFLNNVSKVIESKQAPVKNKK